MWWNRFMATTVDWYDWHAPYDELVSAQTVRLAAVQDRIGEFLDEAPPGRLRAISLAAGQSRDLLPMMIHHRRGGDIRALLVELDERNAEFAAGAADSAGLADVQVVTGDAGVVDTFVTAVPADLVLVCGVFDQLGADAVESTIAALPQLCAERATVIWADGPLSSEAVQLRGRCFAEAGFAVRPPVVTEDFAVGVCVLERSPMRWVAGTRMFTLG